MREEKGGANGKEILQDPIEGGKSGACSEHNKLSFWWREVKKQRQAKKVTVNHTLGDGSGEECLE